jgi:hypothetical protein
MTESNSKNTPDQVPTFLKFGDSPEFSQTTKRFMKKDVIERMGNKSIVFYSQHVALLSMLGGVYTDPKVAQAMGSYEKRLHDKEVANQKLKFYRYAEMVDLGVKGLKLAVILRLNNSVLSTLATPPLFPEYYNSNIEVYTKIPRALLLNDQGIDYAYENFKSDLSIIPGQTTAQSDLEAPWQMHLTGTHIFQLPKVQKPVESEEVIAEELDTTVIDIKQMIQHDLDRRRAQPS